MPLLEAFTNDAQALSNKLVTLPKNTQILPVVSIAQSSISLTNPGQFVVITPQTLNVTGANSGYSFTIGNTDIVSIQIQGTSTDAASGTVVAAQARGASYIPPQTGNKLAGTINGLSVKLTAYSISQTTSTTLTISGNDTGGTVTIPVTVSRDSSLD